MLLTNNFPVRKLLFALATLFLSTLTSCDLINSAVSPVLSEADISTGLKSLLKVGADTAVKNTSALNGFYADNLIKIPFPPQAQQVYTTLVTVVGQKTVDDFVLKLNRGAEKAAVEAEPIFVDAITSITLTDAAGILHGTDSAATAYLRKKTSSRLDSLFRPKVAVVLAQPLVAGVSADDGWQTITTTYNAATLNGLLGDTINTDLHSYVTAKALRGLFLKLSAEEKYIRQDPKKRVTDAIRKIFS